MTGLLNTVSGHFIYQNGTQFASNTNTTGFTTLGGTNSGIIGAGFAYNSQFIGDVGEVLIYNTALYAAQQTAVQQYLQAKWQGMLPATSPVTLSGGGTLNLNGDNQMIASLASSDPTTAVLLGSGYLTVGGTANASTTFAGAISGAGGLGKIGSGVLTLTGASNYSGGTAINAGILQLGNSAALGAGAVALSSGTLDLAGNSILVGGLSARLGHDHQQHQRRGRDLQRESDWLDLLQRPDQRRRKHRRHGKSRRHADAHRN